MVQSEDHGSSKDECMRESSCQCGGCSFAWVNMAKEYAKAFYKSKRWEKCRAAYISYRGGLCERCYAQGIVKAGVIVHHKKYITPENINDPMITTDFSNLELLCHECHDSEHDVHFEPRRRKKRYEIDDLGRVTVTE